MELNKPLNFFPASKTLFLASSRSHLSYVYFSLSTYLLLKEDNYLPKYLLFTTTTKFFHKFTLKSKHQR